MTTKSNTITLGWLDAETGGLDGKQKDGSIGMDTYPILELAMHITDSDLNILDPEGFHVVIHHDEDVLAAMDPWCIEQHTKSGLLDEVRKSTVTLAQAEEMAIAHLKKHGAEPYNRKAKSGTVMAGNSIKLDRNFLNCQMPDLDKYFHYRQADLSAVALFVRNWRPDVEAMVDKQYKHLALEDIRESIMEAKVYKDRLFRDDCVVSDTIDIIGTAKSLTEDFSRAVVKANLTDARYQDDPNIQQLQATLLNLLERANELSESIKPA